MAGAKLELSIGDAESAIGNAVQALEHPAPLLQSIIEYLHVIHRARFRAMESPQGVPWKPLSAGWLKRKHKNIDKILIWRGHLVGTLRGVITGHDILFGTPLPYGAAHQFGASITVPAHYQDLHFKRTKTGIGNKFVKKSKSNYAERHLIPEHQINVPARPWLGTNQQQDQHIVDMTMNYLQRHLKK